MRLHLRTPPIVGRAPELRELLATLERAAHGVGTIVVLEGEAGIGKSRLLEAAIEAAVERGLVIASGAAYELTRDRPFAAIVDALDLRATNSDTARAEIGAMLSGAPVNLLSADLSNDRFRISDRIVDLVERDGARAPVLLVVEDLHWADPATLLVLHRLAGSLEHLSIALVATLRPTPRSGELLSLLERLDARGANHLMLHPLDPESVGELVAGMVGARPGARLAHKVTGAAGNPLFVAELLTALAQEELIDTSAGIAEVAEASLPPSLAVTILRRLAFLSAPALEALRMASVLGPAFTVSDLSTITRRPVSELIVAIDEAKAARLVGEQGDHLVFRHELVRDAIYQDMLEPVRNALHLQVARALADADAPVAQVAAHALIGAKVGDMQAAAWLNRAAKDAASHAPLASVELLERALELARGDTIWEQQLSLSLAWALLAAGRPVEVERVAHVLAKSEDPGFRLEAIRADCLAFHFQGRWHESVERLDHALSDPRLGPIERLRLTSERAYALSTFRCDRAAPEAEAALSLSEKLADPLSRYLSALTMANCLQFEGYFERALSMADRAIEHATAVRGDDPRAAEAEHMRCWTLGWADRFEEAEAAYDAYRRAYEDAGWVRWARFYPGITTLYLAMGRWDDAVVEGETGAVACEEAALHIESFACRQFLCYIAIHRDDLAGAGAHLNMVPGAMWTRALLAEARGDTASLEETLEAYRTSLRSSTPWHMPQIGIVARDWVRLYLHAGDRESARMMTAVAEEAARRAPVPSLEATAIGCRGLVEDDIELLTASAELHRRAGRPYPRAQAFEEAAVAFAARGDAEHATGLLLEAIDVYESLGALRDIARAEALLRPLGVRRGRRGPRKRPRSGWESLTDKERRVVALVAEGHTYGEIGRRLFISRRTVETHVAHVFTKVGLSSRRELAEAGRRRGP